MNTVAEFGRVVWRDTGTYYIISCLGNNIVGELSTFEYFEEEVAYQHYCDLILKYEL